MINKLNLKRISAILFGAVMGGTVASASAETYQISTDFGKEHVVSELVDKFAELIKQETDGKFTVKVHYGSPFGDPYQISQQVANGQRKIEIVSMASNVDERLAIGYMGGLVSSYEEAYDMYGPDGKFLKLMNKLGEDIGYKYIAWAPTGFGGIAFGSKAPDKIPSDKLLNVRVAPYKGMIARYEKFGFNPIPMPYTETYTAMQTGAIDGKGATPPQEAAQVFADITKTYIYSRDYFEGIIGIGVNLDWYKSQSPEIQKALDKAGYEATSYVWSDAENRDNEFLEKMREKGINVITFSQDEYDHIKDITRESEWPILEEMVGEKVMEEIKNIAY